MGGLQMKGNKEVEAVFLFAYFVQKTTAPIGESGQWEKGAVESYSLPNSSL